MTASSELQELEFFVDKLFQAKKNVLRVKDVRLEDDKDLKGNEMLMEKGKYIMNLLEDYSVAEAVDWIRGLQNAIEACKYMKTKDWTVKDLEIQLKGTPDPEEIIKDL